MNKKYYRVIFSKTQQRLVVVSEITKSESKSSANSPSRGGIFANLWQKVTACSLKPITFSLFCALGFVSFSESALA